MFYVQLLEAVSDYVECTLVSTRALPHTLHAGRWQRPTIVHGDVVKIHIACGCLRPVPDVKGTIWFIALDRFGAERLNTTRFQNTHTHTHTHTHIHIIVHSRTH